MEKREQHTRLAVEINPFRFLGTRNLAAAALAGHGAREAGAATIAGLGCGGRRAWRKGGKAFAAFA